MNVCYLGEHLTLYTLAFMGDNEILSMHHHQPVICLLLLIQIQVKHTGTEVSHVSISVFSESAKHYWVKLAVNDNKVQDVHFVTSNHERKSSVSVYFLWLLNLKLSDCICYLHCLLIICHVEQQQLKKHLEYIIVWCQIRGDHVTQ